MKVLTSTETMENQKPIPKIEETQQEKDDIQSIQKQLDQLADDNPEVGNPIIR
jgi:hypothetical protein